MSTRTSSLAALVLLAACSRAAEAPPDPDSLIECALGGAERFSPVCWAERGDEDGRRILVVHHPDGGFRRFEVHDGDPWVSTADGAQQASVTISAFDADSGMAVAVGNDRYYLRQR